VHSVIGHHGRELLDEWSRKAIQWRISRQGAAEESRFLLKGCLVDQGFLETCGSTSDRTWQIRANTMICRLCEHHAMPHNPFTESAFSTGKRARQYPGRFRDNAEAHTHFAPHFTYYDSEHDHSGIDYVTPQQAHEGLRQAIVYERRRKKLSL
jgi:putative transposase